MLPIFIILVVAIFLCTFLLPGDTNTQRGYAMSRADTGIVLGVSEELGIEHYEINQVVPGYKPLPKNENIESGEPKFIGGEQIDIANCRGAVMDEASGMILYDKDADIVVPIASITKLMTAIVFLDNNPGWETDYEVRKSDSVSGGKIYLAVGSTVKVKDLMYTSLVGSANTATMALARSTGLTDEEFVIEMNKTAKDMGLENTEFVDPVGLSYGNLSTAREVVKLAKIALEKEEIRKAVSLRSYEYETLNGAKKIIKSTNALLYSGEDIETINLGGKTGFTNAAGYCFVGKFKNKEGKEVISAILGGPSLNSRFSLARNLSEWAFNSYVW